MCEKHQQEHNPDGLPRPHFVWHSACHHGLGLRMGISAAVKCGASWRYQRWSAEHERLRESTIQACREHMVASTTPDTTHDVDRCVFGSPTRARVHFHGIPSARCQNQRQPLAYTSGLISPVPRHPLSFDVFARDHQPNSRTHVLSYRHPCLSAWLISSTSARGTAYTAVDRTWTLTLPRARARQPRIR